MSLVRVRSHRARHRLYRLLGVDELPGFYDWNRPGAEWREIPDERLAEARDIPGITAARVDPDTLRPYIDWN